MKDNRLQVRVGWSWLGVSHRWTSGTGVVEFVMIKNIHLADKSEIYSPSVTPNVKPLRKIATNLAVDSRSRRNRSYD